MAGTARGASPTEDATTCQAACVTCGGEVQCSRRAANNKTNNICDISQCEAVKNKNERKTETATEYPEPCRSATMRGGGEGLCDANIIDIFSDECGACVVICVG